MSDDVLDKYLICALLISILVVLYMSWKQDKKIRNNVTINTNISVFKKVVNSSCNGIMRGAFIGYLTGGTSGAVSGSIIYGLANPILTYTKHNLLNDEEL